MQVHINDMEMQAELLSTISIDDGMFQVGNPDIKRSWYESYQENLEEIQKPNSELRKTLKFLPETSEYQSKEADWRYNISAMTFEELPPQPDYPANGQKETIFWGSGIDTVMKYMVKWNEEKTILFYTGFYNGMSYFHSDLYFVEKAHQESLIEFEDELFL